MSLQNRMRFRLIACEVFVRQACLAIANSPHTVDPVFTPKAAHDHADHLREEVGNLVTQADESGVYDAVLLALGLCGNGVVGIGARTVPLVIPRAHDCCTLFLGSRAAFLREFGNNLSATWSSIGYGERGDDYLRESEVGSSLGLDREFDEYVNTYGEENARYIWETLHPETHQKDVIFIEDPEIPDTRFRASVEARALEEKKSFRCITGSTRLIRMLIHGEWNDDEFLVVPPGSTIRGVYDHDRVVDAGPANEENEGNRR